MKTKFFTLTLMVSAGLISSVSAFAQIQTVEERAAGAVLFLGISSKQLGVGAESFQSRTDLYLEARRVLSSIKFQCRQALKSSSSRLAVKNYSVVKSEDFDYLFSILAKLDSYSAPCLFSNADKSAACDMKVALRPEQDEKQYEANRSLRAALESIHFKCSSASGIFAERDFKEAEKQLLRRAEKEQEQAQANRNRSSDSKNMSH